MQEQVLQSELTDPAVPCPPDNLPTMDDKATVTGGPKTEFKNWLDGLASVMTAFQQYETTGATGSNPTAAGEPDEVEGTSEMASFQPETNNLAAGADEPIQPVKEDIASWNEPSPVFSDSQSNPDMPVRNEPEATTQAGSASQTGAAIEEENAHLWNELGNIYFNTGAYAEAINAFEKAIELDRSYGWSYNNLAALYSHQGRYKDAIPLCKKGLQFLRESKDKALLWNRLGDAYRRLHDHDRAKAAYRNAMELDPDNVSLLTRARFSLLGNCRA
jgi:tetratricopeptide (TPR) repeat protein